MNHYLILLLILILASCGTREVKFSYELMESQSGILVNDFKPTTREEFDEILTSVNDTLKMDSINVYVLGEDVNRINPDFRERYYRGTLGQMDLHSFNNDTTRAMKNLRLWMGVFKGDMFRKNDDWDEKLLNNRFFIDSYK